jgi:plastocyanin
MKAFLALALVTAMLAGCSGSTTTGPVTPQKDANGNYVIHMLTSNQFSPKDAKVPVGANVTWVHDGGAAHNVMDMGSTQEFASPTINFGSPDHPGSYTHKFAAAGVFHYHCSFHAPMMEATLTVA